MGSKREYKLSPMHDRTTELENELARARAQCDALALELEEAQHYRRAVEGSPVSTLCVSGAKGRYVFINEAFAKMLGHDREELLARDPFEVFAEVTPADEFELERAVIGRVARGEIDSYQLDKRVIAKSGESRWVRMDAFASRDAEGRLECMTAFFTDTEQQRALALAQEKLQAQLQEAQKLGAIGKLAGGIAHDFNNRLVIIMGYGELLKRGLPADSPLAHHADMVLASAKRAAELTRQLLAYSRRQVLKPEAFDLNEMAERMKQLLSTAIGDRVELLTVLGATREILADPGQIEQVILNLALNARDAMPGGGRLTLETKDVTFGPSEHPTLPPGDYVSLVVSDAGTGIPEGVLPHIFEPFFTTKETGQGTGLGLSMVEGIVHQSGGATGVESTVGKGTTFTIHLPHAHARAVPASVRVPSESARPRDVSFETVLVCDDDDEVRELLVKVLGLRAYSILSARNGRHALEVARRHEGPIHLLVTDVAMPELSGIELSAALRKRHPGLRVLYISGYTENADLLSAPLGPRTYFLAKPFLPGDLTSTVSSILERSTERASDGTST